MQVINETEQIYQNKEENISELTKLNENMKILTNCLVEIKTNIKRISDSVEEIADNLKKEKRRKLNIRNTPEKAQDDCLLYKLMDGRVEI